MLIAMTIIFCIVGFFVFISVLIEDALLYEPPKRQKRKKKEKRKVTVFEDMTRTRKIVDELLGERETIGWNPADGFIPMGTQNKELLKMNEVARKCQKIMDTINASDNIVLSEDADIRIIKRKCVWTYTEFNVYKTECGKISRFEKGTPKDNEIKYCFNCGGEIVTRME
jgi:hypothetical protein